MPRANRLRGEGGVFHVTHRCHNKEFFLKFAQDRNAYRDLLREHAPKFEVSILDYCITRNHVHLLLDAVERLAISAMMREVASEFARAYNKRKGRTNAFWGDNYHATLVEDGRYLWECLCYIELNMVRCGVVPHPQEWEWVGFHEITGQRQRYRLVALDQLCWRLGTDDVADVRKNLAASLAERIERDELKRQAKWTESLAVGSAKYVKKIQPMILSRRETNIVETEKAHWVLRESPIPYSAKTAPKIAVKA
jgi:putative transposase